VGGRPSALAFDGDNMWVSNHFDDNVMKLRASTYESETSPETMDTNGPFSAPLSGLDLGTTYHFRARAVGDGTAYGDDMTFTTYCRKHTG